MCRILFILLLNISVAISISQGETISFDFDSGYGNEFTVINSGNIWNIDFDGPSLRISKSADDGSINGNSSITGGLKSNFLIGGDFTITVDFQLFNFPATTEIGLYNESLLSIISQNEDFFEIYRLRSGTNSKLNAYSSSDAVVGSINSIITQGSYRLVRNSDSITAFYLPSDSTDFISIGTINNFSDPVQVLLAGYQGHGPYDNFRSQTSMDISFDNFVVQADSIKVVPVPSGIILLFSGTLGIISFRKILKI